MADFDVEVREVTKTYGAMTAVRDVTLRVARGEFFSILGPSGCGKTTILRMVAGFLEPTAGEILIGGQSMHGVPPHRRPTSLVFQHLALFPLMTVYDNIAFGLRMRKAPEAEIRRRVAEKLELINLPGYEAKFPHQLSGGEKQRVAIARSLVIEPTVLLLDDWYVNDQGGHEAMAHPAMISQANYFTVNGKAFPGAEPLKLVQGETVRIRMINAGYQVHSMHLHGHAFVVTHRDGRRVRVPQEQDTLLIGPGERYDLVVKATDPGLWLFHCHVVPHVTNDGQYPGGLLIPVVTTPRQAAAGPTGKGAAPAHRH